MQIIEEEKLLQLKRSVTFQVGQEIKRFRKLKRLSQTELALMVGKDRQYLYKIESGKVTPNIATISSLAYALEISLAELFLGVVMDGVNQ